MPRYEFQCDKCGISMDVISTFENIEAPRCCEEQMKRNYSAPAVVFKGSGFYKTDSRGKK